LTIEEIANATDFFLSPLSQKITGQTIYFGGPDGL
jgi:enoyl-[acyl-carrier-protein] reductase (NADH)